MPRGRPPGIRRKLAAQKEELSEKLAVSQVGEVAEHPEFGLIKMIQEQLPYITGRRPDVSQRRALQNYLGIFALCAIAEGDVGFFQRCAEALRDVVDPKGARVLEAVYRLARAPGCPPKISSENVLDELQNRYPGEPPLDAKDVRDVMKGLGLRFPFERDHVRNEDARKSEELRRVVSTPVQDWPGFPKDMDGDSDKNGEEGEGNSAGSKRMTAAEVAAEFHRLVEAGREAELSWDEEGKLRKARRRRA